MLTNIDTQGKSALESKSKIKLFVSNLIFMLFQIFWIQARDPNTRQRKQEFYLASSQKLNIGFIIS